MVLCEQSFHLIKKEREREREKEMKRYDEGP